MKTKNDHAFGQNSGQALVMLLVFMIMAITITGAAVTIMITSSQAASTYAQGTNALGIAESGAEDALLRLLRSPSYSGETLTIDAGGATVGVVGDNPKVVTSVGSSNGFTRTIQVTVSRQNGVWTITNWVELF